MTLARRWWLAPAAIALASRGLSVLLVLAANTMSHPPHADPFAIFDASWYLSIARTGYHAMPVPALSLGTPRLDFAFFPLWPVVIHVVTLPGLPEAETAVVLANVLFVIAAVLVWRVFAGRFDSDLATRAVALFAFSPAAYVFSLAYSESLFVLLAAVYFLLPATSYARGWTAAAAMLTRISGAALVAAAAWTSITARGAGRRVALVTVFLGALAFAAWWLYVAILTGDPLGFLHGSPSWQPTSGLGAITAELRRPDGRGITALAWCLVTIGGALVIMRRQPELAVYAVASVALALLPGGLVTSMPRYALVAFPAFAGIADRLGRRSTLVVMVALAVFQWYFVTLAFVFPAAKAP